MFTFLKERKARKEQATRLYRAAVEQSRLPIFYDDYAVPDSVDGRFEMTALHCFLLMRRLQRAGDKKLSQKLFDVFFVSMDRTLREMGVGDLGVPKHMKRMMQGFNGRADHYERALSSDADEDLKEALCRNVYGTTDEPNTEIMQIMVGYVRESGAMKTLDPVFAPLPIGEKKRA